MQPTGSVRTPPAGFGLCKFTVDVIKKKHTSCYLKADNMRRKCEELLTFDCSCRYEAGPREEREEMRMSKSGMEDMKESEMKLY